jgi:hypothetical protein
LNFSSNPCGFGFLIRKAGRQKIVAVIKPGSGDNMIVIAGVLGELIFIILLVKVRSEVLEKFGNLCKPRIARTCRMKSQKREERAQLPNE